MHRMVIIQASLRESFSGSATLLHLHSFTHTINKFIHTCIQEIVIVYCMSVNTMMSIKSLEKLSPISM